MKVTNATKNKEFCRTKMSFGDHTGRPAIKRRAATTETSIEMVKDVFKRRTLSSELGRNLMRPKPSPNVPMKERSRAVEIKAEPNPKSSVE
jgi:hypothetical protein